MSNYLFYLIYLIKREHMTQLTATQYRELFKLRAEGKLESMECTKSLFKFLKPIYADNMNILDIPCGLGHYFYVLKDLGNFKYYGVDLDSEAVLMAKDVWKNNPEVNFSVQDIKNLNFDDGFFDIAICYNLILHLKEYKLPLKELFRVSKKYIFVRSLFDDQTSINTLKSSDDYKKVYSDLTYQYNTYSKEEMISYVKTLGNCNVTFFPDKVDVSNDSLKKQAELLGTDVFEFAESKSDKKENFKGLELNYELMLIEKLER